MLDKTILVARVIHFFDGEQIELAARHLASWLKPGGALFVIGDSVYAKIFEPCGQAYEKRRRLGLRWPGYFTGLKHEYGALARHLADSFHLVLEDVRPHARPDYPDIKRLDEREAVGAIFRKASHPP